MNLYLINHANVEALTTGRTIISVTNSPLIENNNATAVDPYKFPSSEDSDRDTFGLS